MSNTTIDISLFKKTKCAFLNKDGKKCKYKSCDIECKCGNFFCLAHRLTFDHNCSVNSMTAHKNKIIKQNPTVIGEKFIKI
jgi:hypothetical protein